jgi:hypothetical protein
LSEPNEKELSGAVARKGMTMRVLINENVYGWTMTGLLGEGGAWFFGHSKRPHPSAMVSLTDIQNGGLAIRLDVANEGRAANIARNLVGLMKIGASEPKEPQ